MDSHTDRDLQQTNCGLFSVDGLPCVVENSPLLKRFMHLVKHGDPVQVDEILRRHHQNIAFNIDCLDTYGRNALELATIQGNNEMVEILLSHGADLGDSFLYAVDMEKENIVRTMLEYPCARSSGSSSGKVKPKESLFAPHVTPVILAAHRNNYNILKLLLEQQFPRPSTGSISGSTNHRVMLDYYRAVASPCYILLTSHDPFETAFGIKEELNTIVSCLETGKGRFQEISMQLDDFTAELIGFARCPDEVMTVLNVSDNMEDIRGVRMRLLQRALEVGHKKLVVHDKCQELLNLQWYRHLHGLLYSSAWKKYLASWLLTSLTPVIAVLYLAIPTTRIGQSFTSPFVKFSSKGWSWILFLHIMVYLNGNQESGSAYVYIAAYYCWVLGMAWEEVKEIWTGSADAWNKWDLLLLVCHMASIGCYISGGVAIQRDPGLLPSADEVNPFFIATYLLAMAVILSYARFMSMFMVSETIGPLLLSMVKMIVDICRFIIVFSVVIVGFACALQRLYSSPKADSECFLEYHQAVQDQREANNTNTNVSFTVTDFCYYGDFAHLHHSIFYLFWTLYGKFELSDLDLTSPNAVKFPVVSTWLSRILFIVYITISIIILLNMLIAMMSDSFSSVSSDAVTEWYFSRSREMLKYIPKGRTLPPPFNLIPTPKSIWHFMKWLYSGQCTGKVRTLHLQKDEIELHQTLQKYKVTVKRLSSRYLLAYSLHQGQAAQ